MSLDYGFVKAKIKAVAGLKAAARANETQYHVHLTLALPDGDWDVAINVGTNDADDLLKYKLVYDFHHPVTQTLAAAAEGYTDLTGGDALPALDYVRSDVLNETGGWRMSDVMDGTEHPEPIPSVLRLVDAAHQQNLDLYVFGRTYVEGNGIHDTHMNQGSSGPHFLHRPGVDTNDHNDVWQDGALLVDLGGRNGLRTSRHSSSRRADRRSRQSAAGRRADFVGGRGGPHAARAARRVRGLRAGTPCGPVRSRAPVMRGDRDAATRAAQSGAAPRSGAARRQSVASRLPNEMRASSR